MKKMVMIIVLLSGALMHFQCSKTEAPEPVAVPDINFLNALIGLGIDTDNDGLISPEEAEAVTSVDVSNRNISDLTGIGSFINLSDLRCSRNKLTSIDISENKKITVLYCYANHITSLDISHNLLLEKLYCYNNELVSLPVLENVRLKELSCFGNPLTELDCTGLSVLEYLECFDTELTTLRIANCTGLLSLECHNNISESYHPHLTELDLSDSRELRGLTCSNNMLTDLDLSECLKLNFLGCDGNQFTVLDISKNTQLEVLYIRNMPSLIKVCVWELPFPTGGIYVYKSDSPNAYYTTECY